MLLSNYFFLKAKKLKEKCPYHDGNGPYEDENVPSGCYFFRIPHKVIKLCKKGRKL